MPTAVAASSTSPTNCARSPVVIGAGVGGLALALGLRRIGISVTVLERAPVFREVGAGLLLAPRAVAVLDALGITSTVFDLAHPTREWRVLDQHGRVLSRVRLPRPALSIHRADLLAVLRAGLPPDTVRLGTGITSTLLPMDGQPQITLADGTVITPSALIGADGIRSRVRSALNPKAATYRGYIGWRGIAPQTPEAYRNDWLSESWGRGQRFGIAAIGAGRCYWYASANVPETYQSPGGDIQADLLNRFKNWHRPVPELIAATPAQTLLADPIRDHAIGSWPHPEGPVTLVGDAAHAMTPNLGQGACQALEDAHALVQAWQQESDATSAFRRYEKIRRRRAAFIQTASRVTGWMIQLEHPALTNARDLALRLLPDALARQTLRPILDVPIR